MICSVENCTNKHDAKGFCRTHYKKWRRHGDPLITKQAPRGSGWIQRGHKYITVNNKNVPEHRVIVEKAIGRKLNGDEVVHHMDENGLNNAKTNLCVCPDNAYHKLLHQRINAMKACGNPNWRKCPYCKKYDNPLNMRGEKCGRFVHAICSAKSKRETRRNKDVHSIQKSN